MQGIIRASARLALMGAVMAGVLLGALFAGLGTTTAIALGIVLAGVVGLVGVARRPRKLTPTEEIEAMLAADPLDREKAAAEAAAAAAAAAAAHESSSATTRVESMAPHPEVEADPEANMPRWRRPSLLAARHSDPTRPSQAFHMPMRFGESTSEDRDVRTVRYAVVPVLDRPDEVLGLRLADVGQGDEVEVVGSSGAFLEVLCPNGEQGFIHRTTVAQRSTLGVNLGQDADDAMTALLTARGLI